MKKMTPEDLGFELSLCPEVAREKLVDHIAALEAEVAQTRMKALEEALAESFRLKGEIASRVTGNDQDSMLGSLDTLEERIRALKSTPVQEAPRAEVHAVPALPPGLIVIGSEMASEENGLLPKRRRREHEYGGESAGAFGEKIAYCVRVGCQAYRVRSRGGKHASFYQRPYPTPTDEPGPCEAEP